MKLALRNRIAGWLLEALAPAGARDALDGLVAFARDERSGAAERAILVASGLFVGEGDGVRLRDDLAGDLAALRDRCARFAAAADAVRIAALPADPVLRAVAVAAILFAHRLFFEVHELLEPPWREASGDDREILQGLIQVAVGFHHHEDGNLRGAISLLGEGNAKLFAHVPDAFGVDLAALCRDVEAFAIQLRNDFFGERATGDASASLPPLPRWRPLCPP